MREPNHQVLPHLPWEVILSTVLTPDLLLAGSLHSECVCPLPSCVLCSALWGSGMLDARMCQKEAEFLSTSSG